MDHPPTIALSRAHRLLRQLRAALANLAFDLGNLHLKQQELSAQAAQAAHQRASRSHNSDIDDDDDEWDGSGRTTTKRAAGKRRKSSRVVTKVTTTYSRRGATTMSRTTSQSSTTSSAPVVLASVKTGAHRARRSTGSGGGVSILLDARNRLSRLDGWEQDLVNKALHLIKTYSNILEAAADADEEENPHRVPSLVEMMAREIGWNIEANVRSCREEEQSDSSEEEGVALRRKGELDEGDDETTLVDEWYDACPDYCRPWILIEHATSIVLEGLDGPPFTLLEILFELCSRMGAASASPRFYDPLNYQALRMTDPSSSAHALAQQTVLHGHSSTYIESLRTILFESTFADRLFYSPFLSLERVHLRSGNAGDAEALAGLVELVCGVAKEMVSAIDLAISNGERGGERQRNDVIDRVTLEIGHATGYLFEAQDDEMVSITTSEGTFDGQRLARNQALERVFDAVLAFVLGTESNSSKLKRVGERLGPFAIAACSKLALRSLDVHPSAQSAQSTPNDLARLTECDSLISNYKLQHTEEEDDLDVDHFTTELLPLAKQHSSQSFAALATLLRSAHLSTLEKLIVYTTTRAYDSLVDVRSTRGLMVLDKDIFERRLNELNRHSLSARPALTTPPRPAHLQHLSSSDEVFGESTPGLARSSLGRSIRKGFVPIRFVGTPSKTKGSNERRTVDARNKARDEVKRRSEVGRKRMRITQESDDSDDDQYGQISKAKQSPTSERSDELDLLQSRSTTTRRPVVKTRAVASVRNFGPGTSKRTATTTKGYAGPVDDKDTSEDELAL
ncbi:BQ2448_5275 [Microbotryum intermedium]|uniref:BQ2448_5275 protein n=1 Tax=Microbotryum intermedium TaxID=269621 RepID=A0A238F717_9BASI|nr:BQ2448_5275 [Microbotryum intermedium]